MPNPIATVRDIFLLNDPSDGDTDIRGFSSNSDGTAVVSLLEFDRSAAGIGFTTDYIIDDAGLVTRGATTDTLEGYELNDGNFVSFSTPRSVDFSRLDFSITEPDGDVLVTAAVDPTTASFPAPSLTPLENGGFVMAWVDTDPRDIKIQFFDANGSPLTSQIAPGSTDGIPNLRGDTPVLATRPDGTLGVFWERFSVLRYAAFDQDGNVLVEDTDLGFTASFSGLSQISFRDDGAFVVTDGETANLFNSDGTAAIAGGISFENDSTSIESLVALADGFVLHTQTEMLTEDGRGACATPKCDSY